MTLEETAHGDVDGAADAFEEITEPTAIESLASQPMNSSVADEEDNTQTERAVDEIVHAPASTSATTNSSEFRVRLKMLDERVFDVIAAPSMGIVEFRAKVTEVTQVPAHLQRLIYRGKLMKDGAMLATYDVQDGHTVHLVAKPVTSASVQSDESNFATDDNDAEGLRRLQYSTNAQGRDEAEQYGNRTMRTSIVGRNATVTSRRRVPGVGDPTGDAWNLAVLREALSSTGDGPDNNTTRRSTVARRRGVEEFEASPRMMAAEMGLGPQPTSMDLNNSSNRDEVGSGNMEHLIQAMMTIRTVLSTVAQRTDEQEEQSLQNQEEEGEAEQATSRPQTPPVSPSAQHIRRGRRRFYVGQWLDVKDTVNQWLECTVMDMTEDKILIHYHGWPSRWDEWLDFDSDRIAAFRTRTLHTLNANHVSPVPTTRLPNSPNIGESDIRRVVPQIRELMREIMPHVDRFADLCEEQQAQDEMISSSGPSRRDNEEHDSDVEHESEEAERIAVARLEADISETAHLMAPLFDRFGRLLTDSARCFDSLLRPELRSSSMRQQTRMTGLRRGGERSAGSMARRQQAENASTRAEQEDTSLSIRDLIATSSRAPGETVQPRRSIDVHIHAIVSPSSLSSFAALTNLGSSSNTGSRRNIRTPTTPPVGPAFDEAFGIPSLRPSQGGNRDGRSIINDHDDGEVDVDQSRTPLLSSYRPSHRHQPRSYSTDNSRRRRSIEDNVDAMLADDFFGPSFGGRDSIDSDDDHDGAAPANSRERMARPYQSIPSPSRLSPESSPSRSSIGVIPEIAEAEERERARGAASASGSGTSDERSRAASSSSSASSSSASFSGYPTFLEVMRRTLSGVRNFGFSSSNNSNDESTNQTTIVQASTGFSSPSSSSSSSRFDHNDNSENTPSDGNRSSIEEDLDELD